MMSTAAPLEGGMDLYELLKAAGQETVNPSVKSDLRIIAEMFRKAVEMDDGFNKLYQIIDDAKNDLPDEEEMDNVENILNHIENAISEKAEQPDSGAAERALYQLVSDIKRAMIAEDEERLKQEGIVEGPEAPQERSAYEEEQMDALQRANIHVEEETAGAGVFDQSGGVSKEEAGPGMKGRGYSRIQKRPYKDWIKVYADEKAGLERTLNASEKALSTTGLIARHHAGLRASTKELIGILTDLEKLQSERYALERKIALEAEMPDPANKKRLDEIETTIEEKTYRRWIIKKTIKGIYQDIKLKELEREKAEAAKNPRNKFLLDQKIALQNLRMSGDRGIGEEVKQRQILIDALANDPNLGQGLVERFLGQIQKARETTTKVTDYHRQLALQVAQTKGTKEPIRTRKELQDERVRAPKAGLGRGRIHEWNLAATALEGLVVHLTQRLATERSSTKQKVADKLKRAQKDPAVLKPFMDDAAKAATKKDKTAFLAAARRLDAKMEEFKAAQPETVQLLISLRSSKFFYSFRDQVQKISEWIKNPGALSPEQQTEFIGDAIVRGKKLAEFYKNLHIKSLTPGMPARSTGYKPAVEVIENIVNNLSQMVN